jgi:hypothetical protein
MVLNRVKVTGFGILDPLGELVSGKIQQYLEEKICREAEAI